jgi:hypothetical protein
MVITGKLVHVFFNGKSYFLLVQHIATEYRVGCLKPEMTVSFDVPRINFVSHTSTGGGFTHVGPQGTVVMEAPPPWRALASLKNFLGVIDACRCVLANFEGKLEHFKNHFFCPEI